MDVNDALEQYGKRGSGDVARHLREGATLDALTKRVGARRRQRVGTTVVGSVAAVAVAVAAITSLPGQGGWSSAPASVPITTEAEQAFAPYTLWGLGDMSFGCGYQFDVAPGVLAHDTSLLFELPDDEPNGRLAGERPMVETGTVVSAQKYTTAESEGVSWEWSLTAELSEPAVVAATSIAVQNGVVIGSEPTQIVEGELDGLAGEDLQAATAGVCVDGGPGVTYEPGEYTVHFLVQIFDQWGSRARVSVTDPIEPLVFSTDGGEVASTEVIYPAELREPEGDLYQAFVIAKPTEPSCAPINDQREAGQPKEPTLSYDVTIPGLQEISSQWYDGDPIAIVEDDSFSPWYVDVPAMVVADRVSAGTTGANVGWTRGSTWQEPDSDDVGVWRLLTRTGGSFVVDSDDPLYGPVGPNLPYSDDCLVTDPIPTPEGSMWLVIDGVDWETIEAAHPGVGWETEGLITWVYLGEA